MRAANGLSGGALWVWAAASMTVDHIGAAFYPDVWWMRAAGRIAFPIFAFLLAEGFAHTRSRARYALRLGVFALVSEPFFDAAFRGSVNWRHQNIFFTLLLGVAALSFCERLSGGARGLAVAGCCVAAELGRFDYGAFGVALIWLMFYTRERRGGVWYALLLCCGAISAASLAEAAMGGARGAEAARSLLELWALAAGPLLSRYNGRRGGDLLPKVVRRWGAYLYYPLHLCAVAAAAGRIV